MIDDAVQASAADLHAEIAVFEIADHVNLVSMAVALRPTVKALPQGSTRQSTG